MSPPGKTPLRPWYAAGLRFSCTGCGACCHGDGYVWVDEAEVARLAEHLQLAVDDFGRRYLRRVGGRLALTDGADLACVFWDQGCTVYPARPTQCRTFPFWRDNLTTEAAWKATGEESPGVDRGRLYTLPEIERLATGVGAASKEGTGSVEAGGTVEGDRS
jgi:Fe-S-cluster containining protein